MSFWQFFLLKSSEIVDSFSCLEKRDKRDMLSQFFEASAARSHNQRLEFVWPVDPSHFERVEKSSSSSIQD